MAIEILRDYFIYPHMNALHLLFALKCTFFLCTSSSNVMQAMWLANIVCVGMIQFWANANVMSLGKIWWALAVSLCSLT